MATNHNMPTTVTELSKMLQAEREQRKAEQQRATKREKELRAEMDQMREAITNQETIKYKALERERDASLREAEHLKLKLSALREIGSTYVDETAERERLRQQRDDLQKEVEQLKSQVHREKEVHAERQLRDSEREKTLLRQIAELKEQIRTERDECTDSFVPKIKALEREIMLLKAICGHDNDEETSEGSCENNKADDNEEVTSTQEEKDEEQLNVPDERSEAAATSVTNLEASESQIEVSVEGIDQQERNQADERNEGMTQNNETSQIKVSGEEIKQERNQTHESEATTQNWATFPQAVDDELNEQLSEREEEEEEEKKKKSLSLKTQRKVPLLSKLEARYRRRRKRGKGGRSLFTTFSRGTGGESRAEGFTWGYEGYCI
ncbi:trichohyalin-like [Scomber scombrus]|uniref:Trichohyalin-like n=1 Tax=Scomber scombrus TaxID=13677 RepID=A0AAV1QB91_SCOSC